MKEIQAGAEVFEGSRLGRSWPAKMSERSAVSVKSRPKSEF